MTDSEATLHAINKWIGGGAKLSLARSPDGDVLRAIVVKLQKRVQAGVVTLLIKVKAHRGDPLNEEADIWAEMGHLKEENEKIWSVQTDRTIYQWSETSKTKKGILITITSAWTHASGIECGRKQGKYKHSAPVKEERRDDVRNISNGKNFESDRISEE